MPLTSFESAMVKTFGIVMVKTRPAKKENRTAAISGRVTDVGRGKTDCAPKMAMTMPKQMLASEWR